MIERFHCPATGVTQARASCASRHTRTAEETARKRRKGGGSHIAGGLVCAGCEVGAAHARGEQPTTWPDGSRIETSTIRLPVAAASGSKGPLVVGRDRRRRAPRAPSQPWTEARICIDCDESYLATGRRQKRCKPCGRMADADSRRRYKLRKAAEPKAKTVRA